MTELDHAPLVIFIGIVLPLLIGAWTLKVRQRQEYGCPCCGRRY